MLFATAVECLSASDPRLKVELTRDAASRWRDGQLVVAGGGAPGAIGEPGRPSRPRLVSPRKLPRRSLAQPQGYAALIHSLAHIEFNAINLAWDAVYRFRDFPEAYYGDWIGVAAEEAYHFELLRAHLQRLGYDYGDFDAHSGLWDMAVKTADDPLLRMAVIPRGLEARGLDVTPGMIAKVRSHGDDRAAEILEIILRDEIGHVEVGTRWFRYLCNQRGLDPEETFATVVNEYMAGRLKGPFNLSARKLAGFSEPELALLMTMQKGGSK